VLVPVVAALAASAIVGVGVASGSHVGDVTVSAACDQEQGAYRLSATVTSSGKRPGAYVVGVEPSSLPGDAAGSHDVGVVVGWSGSDKRETVRGSVTTAGDCLRVQARGTVIVKKAMYGGTDTFEFSGTPSGTISENGGTISQTVAPGSYTTTELPKDGWDLIAVACDDANSVPDRRNRRATFNVEPGETVTCTFRNKKRATLIVRKVMLGGEDTFAFTGTPSGSISTNGGTISASVAKGTYTATEAEKPGWQLVSIACDDADSRGDLATRTATFVARPGEVVRCTFTNRRLVREPGSIAVRKSVTPTQLQEPGGPVTYSVRVRNTSPVTAVTITEVVDDRFGSLEGVAGGNPGGCFDLPITLAPGAAAVCQFQKTISGAGGSAHVNVVTARGGDEHGNPVSASDSARVDILPRLIDLVLSKAATSPTPLGGVVTYTLTVTNRGPDTATNVQLADPAPAAVTYLSASPSQGSCALTAALVTCSLGTLAPGQTVTIAVTGRATRVGQHPNTATVTGEGGREQNPADNVASALTVVPAPATPPTTPKQKPKPKAKPEQDVCLALTVSPKMVTADGRPDRVRVRVSAAGRRVAGQKVLVTGPGVRASARSDRRGVAVLTVNPTRPGLVTITAVETERKVCGPRRVGVVGVFLPPVTG
jgi:uncharacterized repeat protein (TIGR01451 family)